MSSLDSASKGFHDFRLQLLLIASVLLGLALVRPTLPVSQNFYRYLFVYDITQSMNVTDMSSSDEQITRLQFAKRATQAELRRIPCGSEVGMALFAGHRTFMLFAPVEVCKHYREIQEVLHRLDWRMGWEAKSEVAKGLHSGLSIAESFSEPTTVVFFTDGHEAPPIHESFRPVFEGQPGKVKGALVGVGGARPSAIPKFDTTGRQLGYWEADEVLQVDPYSMGRPTEQGYEQLVGVDNRMDLVARTLAGQEHLSSLREPYLQRLAEELKLQYVKLNTPGDLRTLLTHSEFAQPRVAHSNLSWIPGLLALLTLLWVQVWGGGSIPGLRLRQVRSPH